MPSSSQAQASLPALRPSCFYFGSAGAVRSLACQSVVNRANSAPLGGPERFLRPRSYNSGSSGRGVHHRRGSAGARAIAHCAGHAGLAPCQRAWGLPPQILASRHDSQVTRLLFRSRSAGEPHRVAHLARSTDESEKWFLEQSGGEYLRVQSRTFGTLSDMGAFAWCGCTTSFQGQVPAMESELVVRDDDTVQLMAKIALALARARVRWAMFFLRGWPCRMLGALQGLAAHNSLLRGLAVDSDNFEQLKVEARGGVAAEVVKRHVFQTVPAQQVRQAVAEAGNKLDGPILDWLRQDVRRFWGSQLVEDSFTRESRRVQVKSNTLSNRETQLNHLLKTVVISSVHHYIEPVAQSNADRSVPIPAEHFQAWSGEASLAGMSNTIGKGKNAEYYSPGAAALHTPFCDLAFIEFAIRNEQIPDMARIWQNQLLNGCSFLVRRKGAQPGPWLFSLGSFGPTAAVGWPARRMPASDADPDRLCFAFDEKVVSLEDSYFVCLLDLGEYEGLQYEWRSLAWQQASWGSHMGQVVAVVSGCAKDILTIAAEAAFWDLPRPILAKIASMQGILVQSGDSTFQVLQKLVTGILGCGADAALDILKRRQGPNDACLESFLTADAGLEVLVKSDEKAAKSAQKVTKVSEDEHLCFRKEYKAQRKVRALEVAKALAKSRKGAATAKVAPTPALQRPPIPEGSPEQFDMKLLLPPGASIWR